jgi:hypothetical protein
MYKYQKELHNESCSTELSKIIFEEFKPIAIFDVGCGLGNFIKDFQNLGCIASGTDGKWVLNQKYLLICDSNSIVVQDLNNPTKLIPEKTDIVISLEVAEHLEPESSERFINYLCSTGSLVVFSAATPWQGGQGHINEKLSSYWIDLFKENGYEVSNYLRSLLWDNEDIFPWYRQNILIFYNNNHKLVFPKLVDGNNQIYNIFSPFIYMPKSEIMHSIYDGRVSWFFLFRTIVKKIAYVFGYRSSYMYKIK